MRFDSFCLSAVVDELEAGSLGTFVDQVHGPGPAELVLELTGRGPKQHWLISIDARWPRFHRTVRRRENPPTPPSFCAQLRKHLSGSRLREVEQPGFDRILRLQFQRGDSSCLLIVEFMGKHSNAILLDEAGQILGALKTVDAGMTRVRPVAAGLPYVNPPNGRPDPRDLSAPELEILLADAAGADDLTRRLSGFGTFPAREALRLGATPAAGAALLMERVRSHAWTPTLFRREGSPAGVWAFESVQEGWSDGEPQASMSEALDGFYSEWEQVSLLDGLRKQAASHLSRTLHTLRERIRDAEAALEGLDETEQLRIQGELLAAAPPQESGASEVWLPNWYDSEQRPLRIPLEPDLSQKENVERLFHRYRRRTASAEAALVRLPELHHRAEELEGDLLAIPLRDETWLRAQIRENQVVPVIERSNSPVRKHPLPAGVRLRRVEFEGWEIYWGENATSNDYLTTRWAVANDIWLHARAVRGAHVVVRGPGGLDRLPQAVLQRAAEIAAAHSEARHSSVVSVDYTLKRHVRKPRGSAPGMVRYERERTLNIAPAE